ncbi:MAG: UDP-N-acetylmuramoyl-L-alanine--D-glutamate ligase [Rhodoferax sp.]|nr:UDP-N-acetylmuramoyl-L-alanine--D-glutamate ligase [Rhodoferax sp.]
MNPEDLPLPPPIEAVPPADAGVGAPGPAVVQEVEPVTALESLVSVGPVELTTIDAAPAPAGGSPAAKPLPTTLTAARDAAAFVANIFAEPVDDSAETADVSTDDEASVDNAAVALEAEVDLESLLHPLRGQKVLILGLGASGLAIARWCARAGADQITVADTRDAPPQLAALQQDVPQARFVAGAFTAALVEGRDLAAVYRSPGLSPADVAPVLEAARAISIRAEGELGLYFEALQGLRAARGYAPAVLAVTGTNGKTTVTSLTGQLVAHAGKTVAVAGNIGPTLLDTLTVHLDAGTLPEVWVLELSSFQLDAAGSFEPTAAVVLNLSQDHLDWHGSMAAYGAAKSQVFGAQGLMVLNRDDAAVMAMLPEPVRVKLQRPQQRAHITFGGDMPQRPGDFGLEEVHGMVWLVRALEADETRRKRNEDAPELHFQRLMPADALRIRGRHNASNALAALALCSAAGCALGPILYGLREYRGEPHRVEPIGILNGVEFFDDSKGTNVGATVAALQGLGADRRVIVILGGEGKGQDFSPLAAPVARYARAVVLVGRDAPLIREALTDTGVPLQDADSMEQAVALANTRAHAGDAVLMSPACASFDMFRNYEHRAEVFVAAVRDLALAQGTDLEAIA